MTLLNKIEDTFRELIAPNYCLITEEKLTNGKFISQNAIDNFNLAPSSWEITGDKSQSVSSFYIRQLFGLISASENSDIMDIVYKMKYQPYFKIGIELGELLGKKILMESEIEFDVIVPVPIHSAKWRERGFNQSYYIAKGLSNKLGLPIDNKAVKRKFYTGSQTIRTSEERQKNMKKAITYSKPAREDLRYLICDDVYTTGSTLNAAAKALINAGATETYGASIIIA